jgi:hypothetical protein
VKLDPTPEEEEDLTTDVVLMESAEEQNKSGGSPHVEFIEKVVINLDDDVDDGASTLIGGLEYGDKEIDMEVTDSEGEGDQEQGQGIPPEGDCGVKRKRTIRVIIRSRAFL